MLRVNVDRILDPVISRRRTYRSEGRECRFCRDDGAARRRHGPELDVLCVAHSPFGRIVDSERVGGLVTHASD
jgi:hypothetical protein